jgi:hypothetical protein
VGVRPHVAHREARQGAGRGGREELDRVSMKDDWKTIFPPTGER